MAKGPAKCSVCGLRYKDFRAPGQPTFAAVVEEMYVASPDRSKWKRRSKGNVVGRMHEYKAQHWHQHLEQCEEEKEHGWDPLAPAWDLLPF